MQEKKLRLSRLKKANELIDDLESLINLNKELKAISKCNDEINDFILMMEEYCCDIEEICLNEMIKEKRDYLKNEINKIE